MATQSLVRPAAAAVRTMLQRIKMENIERASSSIGGQRGSKFMATAATRPKSMKFQQIDWKQAGYPTASLSE